MTDQQLADSLRQIARKYLPDPAYKVFIFGSRAQKTNRKFSDVDLGILGPNPVPDTTKFRIEEDLEESNIPYLVDLVDFHDKKGRFKDVALSVTIPI